MASTHSTLRDVKARTRRHRLCDNRAKLKVTSYYDLFGIRGVDKLEYSGRSHPRDETCQDGKRTEPVDHQGPPTSVAMAVLACSHLRKVKYGATVSLQGWYEICSFSDKSSAAACDVIRKERDCHSVGKPAPD